MRSFFRRLRDRARAAGRRVQVAVVQASLFGIYMVGFGVARAWAALFHRRLLAPPPQRDGSYWLPAAPADLSPAERKLQS